MNATAKRPAGAMASVLTGRPTMCFPGAPNLGVEGLAGSGEQVVDFAHELGNPLFLGGENTPGARHRFQGGTMSVDVAVLHQEAAFFGIVQKIFLVRHGQTPAVERRITLPSRGSFMADQ
jgi:hypothetical protein